MKKYNILFLVCFILLSPVYGIGANIEKAGIDDEYTYNIFNTILKNFENILKNMAYDEEIDKAHNESTIVYTEVITIRNDVIYYESSLNVSSKSKYVYKPFYKFAKSLVKLCEYDVQLRILLAYRSKENVAKIRIIINEMLAITKEMHVYLDEIDKIDVLKKGNETLWFDSSGVRKYLHLYELKLLNLDKITPLSFTIAVSNNNPILYETIYIYGTSDEDGNVDIYIEGDNYSKVYHVKTNKLRFSTSHTFDKLGTYKIYAIQNNKKSNVVIVKVGKIPTFIIGDNKIIIYPDDKNITLKYNVVDYYGNRLNGTVLLTITNGTSTKTIQIPLHDGYLLYTFGIEDLFGVLKILLAYNEDDIHLSTLKDVDIEYYNISASSPPLSLLSKLINKPQPMPWYGYLIPTFSNVIIICVLYVSILLIKIKKILISSKKLFIIFLRKLYKN